MTEPGTKGLQAAESARERGNKAFNDLDYPKALKLYGLAVSMYSSEDVGSAEVRDGLVKTHTNRALIYIKQGLMEKAEADCDKALSHDPAAAKPRFRRLQV